MKPVNLRRREIETWIDFFSPKLELYAMLVHRLYPEQQVIPATSLLHLACRSLPYAPDPQASWRRLHRSGLIDSKSSRRASSKRTENTARSAPTSSTNSASSPIRSSTIHCASPFVLAQLIVRSPRSYYHNSSRASPFLLPQLIVAFPPFLLPQLIAHLPVPTTTIYCPFPRSYYHNSSRISPFVVAQFIVRSPRSYYHNSSRVLPVRSSTTHRASPRS